MWGQCNVIEDDLRVVQHRDVFLHHWSIYDRGGRMIEDSGFFRAFPDYASVGGPFTVEPPANPPCMPDADLFWLGLFQDHFGHFLIGTLARLWALAQHADAATRIVYVGALEPDELYARDYIRLCLEALGIRREQLVRVAGPMRFPALLIAEPAFVECFSASPVYHAMMRGIATHVLGGTERDAAETDVFLSKALIASGNRSILNEAELTDELAREGVVIKHPERLGFADQMRLWSRTRLAMGFSGSAFHTSVFRGGQSLCTLSNNLAASANQALIDRVSGNRSLFLQAVDGLREEASSANAFSVSLIIADPKWMAGELLRVAEAFRAGRLSPQTYAPSARRLWATRSGPMPFGTDLSPRGSRRALERGGRASHWQVGWKNFRVVNAVRVSERNASGSMPAEPTGPFSVQVSGDGTEWHTMPDPSTLDAKSAASGRPVFTWLSGYPMPARFVRIEVAPGNGFDIWDVAVLGEAMEPELGLPDALMRSMLDRRARKRLGGRIVRLAASAFARLAAILSRR